MIGGPAVPTLSPRRWRLPHAPTPPSPSLHSGRQGFAHAFDIVHTTRGNERAMAARLAADPRVDYAEPN